MLLSSQMEEYNPIKIEKKWRKKWEKEKLWNIDVENAKNPYYNLMMFPYPSAEGLHIGNVYAFTGADIHGRYMRMRGYDVFEPLGFDAFGIHSENFAIKKGTHPKEETEKNVSHFREQLKRMGALFDWDREVDTSKPEYYKWTQWLFLQLYKHGLAYRAKAPVDWCPSCKTVLADEQVIGGKCERCGTEVIQKELLQWFFKITDYAERLLDNLDEIDWPEAIKTAQRNWIGKSEGALIKFKISNFKSQISVFTTRPDTLFGATYIVLAPEHHLVAKLKGNIENRGEVEKYIEGSKKKNELERTDLAKEKTGVELKGIKAINPANNEEIPVWIADYVSASYGTGAIMAVPAHDDRDFEFANKFGLVIRNVIKPQMIAGDKGIKQGNLTDEEFADYGERQLANKYDDILEGRRVYTGEGKLRNSGDWDGMHSLEVKGKIIESVGGEKKINYHLRDWLISRQRYWGPPIPIIYCEKCGIVAVLEKDLPVELPQVEDFRPTGTDKSPLATVKEFVKTKCPECGAEAKRETDVSDNFLDSSWYFLRYPSTDFKDKPFDEKITKKWLPVQMYIGGKEHAVLHLMYARFVTMALRDFGFIDFEEPFTKFRAHGLLIKDGAKMSKSKGNVVNPDEYFDSYGADIVRMYLMFLGPYEQGGDWRDEGISGIARFLKRVHTLLFQVKSDNDKNRNESLSENDLERATHKAVKKVTGDLENLQYNTAISSLMEFANKIQQIKEGAFYRLEAVKSLVKLMVPFCPHLSEELWHEALGYKTSVHGEKWPEYDESKVAENTVKLAVEINGKVRSQIQVDVGMSEDAVKEMALNDEKIKKMLNGNEPQKIIVVQNRVVNIVI